MVTRQVNDLADDHISGGPLKRIDGPEIKSMNSYLNTLRDPTYNFYTNFQNLEHAHADIVSFRALMNDRQVGETDFMPDTFSFNAPGLSGSIVIDYSTGNAISLDNPDIKATYTKSTYITAWTITAPNGTIYYFNQPEETSTDYEVGGNEGTRKYNSGWYLTKIESSNKKDVFEFDYLPGTYWSQFQSYHNRETKQARLSSCGQLGYDPTQNVFTLNGNFNDYKIKQPTLSKIKHNSTEIIDIAHSGNRLDLSGRNKLASITVKYGATNILKTFNLNHSYFAAVGASTEVDYRLRLDSIDIIGSYNSPTSSAQDTQTYSFDYYGTSTFPGRNSTAIDYYGYYNGASTNTTLVPQYTSQYGDIFTGVDRSPDFTYRKEGMLKEIHYPTGGSTEFTFDSYDTFASTWEPQAFSQGLVSVSSGADPNADATEFDCDDPTYLPHTSNTSFTVDASEDLYAAQSKYWFNVSSQGNPSQTGRFFFMAIYQSSTYKDYCEIQDMITNGDTNLKYYSSAVPTHGAQVLFTGALNGTNHLISGDYKVFIANSLAGRSYSFMRSGVKDIPSTHPVSSVPVVSKIVDKTNKGETVIRTISYTDEVVQQKIKFDAVKTTDDNTNGNPLNCYLYETLELYSTNLYAQMPYELTFGKAVEKRVDGLGNDLGRTEYEYYNQNVNTLNELSPFPASDVYVPSPGMPYIKNYPLNGQPKITQNFDKLGRVLTKEEADYEFNMDLVTSGTGFYSDTNYLEYCTVVKDGDIDPNKERLLYVETTAIDPLVGLPPKQCMTENGYTVINGWRNITPRADQNIEIYGFSPQLKQKVATSYFYEGSNQLPHHTVVSQQDYTYGTAHNMPISVKTTSSNGRAMETRTVYPPDLTSPTPAELPLIAANRISEPIQVESFEDLDEDSIIETNERLGIQYTQYKDWGNNLIQPEIIKAAKGDNVLEERIVFDDYDTTDGNLIEVLKKDGVPATYIWGYNGQYPIAKIENATYSQVSSQVSNLHTKADADDDTCLDSETCDEKTLRTALASLRTSVPNAMVTTYTYDPLIGVTSTTDPTGNTTYYSYDPFGRLKYIKNKGGEVLESYDYHHRVEEVLASTVASSTSVVSGATVTFTTTATGGTGNFQYNWTISNGTINSTVTNATGVLDVVTTSDHAPNFTVDCEVVDTQTSASVTTSTQVTVTVAQPLAVQNMTISPSGTLKAVGNSVTYSVSASGGSGNYTYEWTKTTNQATTSYGGNTNSTTQTVLASDCPSFGVSCKVTDDITGEIITKGTFIIVTSGCSSN